MGDIKFNENIVEAIKKVFNKSVVRNNNINVA